jgi:4-hydroxy-tetrahydrodipicolinate synthase
VQSLDGLEGRPTNPARHNQNMTRETTSGSRRFQGIVTPLVTPLSDHDTLDRAGLRRLIEHVIQGGVSGIFILGTTGEGPSLGYRLRREVITQTCEMVDHRLPVLVGITDTAFVESIDLSLVAADAGATAVVAAPPYYLPVAQSELVRYVEHLSADLPLPLMLYNMPAVTKVWYEIETLRTLSKIETIVGIKDSSGDLSYFGRLMSLREQRPDWSILIGPEHLLPQAIQCGGDGGVCGGSNVFPRLFADCYQAAVRRDEFRLRSLSCQIDALQNIYAVGKTPSRFIQATKCALSVVDICDDFMTEPICRFDSHEREEVRRIIRTSLPELFPVCP